MEEWKGAQIIKQAGKNDAKGESSESSEVAVLLEAHLGELKTSLNSRIDKELNEMN